MFYKNRNKFREIGHTADVGLQAEGATFAELFANLAYGMLDIITANLNSDVGQSLNITLEEESLSDLVVSWLSEINYQLMVHDFLIGRIKSLDIKAGKNAYRLSGICLGGSAACALAGFKTEIKAVTYHQLKVQQRKNGYWAQVIFDI
jgi:SHS2 domain-containing protein